MVTAPGRGPAVVVAGAGVAETGTVAASVTGGADVVVVVEPSTTDVVDDDDSDATVVVANPSCEDEHAASAAATTTAAANFLDQVSVIVSVWDRRFTAGQGPSTLTARLARMAPCCEF
ncbi:unannotated protein [freshwater metagenome]|uniref:Unannotated protein n=1 Tax=freshwater metagenome TaxID=449393 RepID=A0A6J7HSD6_9ZZZZ